MSRIVLIDGYNILEKAYYSVPVMTDSTGLHINAISGFLNIMLRVAEKEKPEYMCVLFGAQDCADRIPEGFLAQLSPLKEVLSTMKVGIFEKTAFSSADLAGTVAAHFMKEEVVLVSGDRTFLQLVSDRIRLCMPETGGGRTELKDYGAGDVEAAYQIGPAQLPALIMLTDLVKIGERTACSLLGTYGSVDGVYAHIDELSQKNIREQLLAGKADIDSKRALYTIDQNAEIDISKLSLEAMKINPAGFFTPEAVARLKKLSLYTQFEQYEQVSQTPAVDIDKDLKVIQVRTAEGVCHVFDMVAEAGHAAVRLIHVRPKNAGELGAHADGQMYLQLDADTEVFGCLVCGIEDERSIYYMEGSSALPEACIREQLEKLLLHEKVSVSVFDVKSDYGELFSAENDRNLSSQALTKQLFDCKIAAYLINPLKSDYEITDIADEYLGIQLPKWSDLFGKSDFHSVFRGRKDECLSYLAKQTYILHQAKPLLTEALEQSQMDRLFRELEMPLTYVLFDMEREGILVKPEELRAYGEALNGRIGELEQAIHTAAGEAFNINSPKQLGEILFEKLKLPGGKKTKTGYSTAAEVLDKLAPEYPVVKDILEYRGLTKLKSTYAEGLAAYIGRDNKIHTNFNQTITATGRLSSTEPNLQNIPMRMELGRRIRKVFVPQEGCIFMDADYSQIELRVLAHMSDDSQLIEAYKMDEDIHRITASKVFHTPFEEVTDLQRRNAKAVNFGIVYGISSFGLSQDLSITPGEAKEYIDAYFKTYPGIKKFLDQMVEDAKDKGYCETMFGRRRPVPELKSTNFNQRSFGERVAMNSPIQGTAADIIKYAMLHVYDALKEKKLKSKLILQIHDELLIETRKDEVEEVQKVLSHEMQNACELAVRLEIDLHTGTDWYEAK